MFFGFGKRKESKSTQEPKTEKRKSFDLSNLFGGNLASNDDPDIVEINSFNRPNPSTKKLGMFDSANRNDDADENIKKIDNEFSSSKSSKLFASGEEHSELKSITE
jgi:uncharacterized protein YydD (DUF2326 family)